MPPAIVALSRAFLRSGTMTFHPAGPADEPRVDRDDAAVGRVEVGTGEQHGALVAEHGQLRDVLVDDRDDRGADVRLHRVAEIRKEQPVPRVGAVVQRDDQVATIVGDTSADEVVRQLTCASR